MLQFDIVFKQVVKFKDPYKLYLIPTNEKIIGKKKDIKTTQDYRDRLL